MSAVSQQLFISVKGHLVLLGKDDDPELILYDPGIKAHLRVYEVVSGDEGNEQVREAQDRLLFDYWLPSE